MTYEIKKKMPKESIKLYYEELLSFECLYNYANNKDYDIAIEKLLSNESDFICLEIDNLVKFLHYLLCKYSDGYFRLNKINHNFICSIFKEIKYYKIEEQSFFEFTYNKKKLNKLLKKLEKIKKRHNSKHELFLKKHKRNYVVSYEDLICSWAEKFDLTGDVEHDLREIYDFIKHNNSIEGFYKLNKWQYDAKDKAKLFHDFCIYLGISMKRENNHILWENKVIDIENDIFLDKSIVKDVNNKDTYEVNKEFNNSLITEFNARIHSKEIEQFCIEVVNELDITGDTIHDLKQVYDWLSNNVRYKDEKCSLDIVLEFMEQIKETSLANDISIDIWQKILDWGVEADDSTKKTQTIMGVINDRETVCAGYSDAFYILCNYLGLKVEKAEGVTIDNHKYKAHIETKKGDHAWNSVVINDKKYYIDVTWGGNKYFLFEPDDYYLDRDNLLSENFEPLLNATINEDLEESYAILNTFEYTQENYDDVPENVREQYINNIKNEEDAIKEYIENVVKQLNIIGEKKHDFEEILKYVSNNIEHTASAKYIMVNSIRQNDIRSIVKTNKGNSLAISHFIQEVCKYLGIETEIITGMFIDNGLLIGSSCVVIYINNTPYLTDVYNLIHNNTMLLTADEYLNKYAFN